MTTHLDGYWFGWSLIILITVDQSVMRSVKEAAIMLQLGVLVSKITSSIRILCLKNPYVLTLLYKDSKKLNPHKMNPMK